MPVPLYKSPDETASLQHNDCMVRPCFLVIDREYSGSISTRKLVIETAKLNVITAYSSAEAIETLERFPSVNGIVLDAGMRDMPCADLIRKLKEIKPSVPIVVVSSPRSEPCDGDHHLESFDPRQLLSLIERLQPEATATITWHDEQLINQS